MLRYAFIFTLLPLLLSALPCRGQSGGEDFLLSADAAVEILSDLAPWPTNSAVVALSGRDKLPEGELTGWQPGGEEFAQALTLSKLNADRQRELLEIYSAAETNFLAYTRARDDYNYRRHWAGYGLYDQSEKPGLETIEFPHDMPEEFLFLLDGLQHFYNGETEEARRHWEKLAQLPPNRKTYCAGWGRVLMAESYAESDPYRTLRELEALRQEFYRKPLNDHKLAACLLRFEASAYAAVTNYPQAMNCYFALNLLGFRNEEMVRHIAQLILQSSGVDLKIAARSKAVAAMTTWHAATLYSDLRLLALSDSDKRLIVNWLRTLKAEDGLKDAADLAAVAAYRAGDPALTADALNAARAMAPFAAWILAKSKLAKSDRKGAMSDLAVIFYSFSEAPPLLREEIGHELAVLYLSDGLYREALKVTLQNGDWQETAYIAEDVLELGELQNFLRERERSKTGDEQLEAKLRYLLARRLARAGRLREALAYYPRLPRTHAEQILTSLEMGENASLDAAERGTARCDAARAIYYGGARLFAAENAPDWLISEGREANFGLWQHQLRSRRGSQLAPFSADEDGRVFRNTPKLSAREVCLENAVSQVWLAVELLPENSDPLAEILCEAGKWTENCDGEVSRRFYETLTARCPGTKLGREAQALRWFPQED